MKFEIESEPLVQEKIVKARLEIDGAGDLLLKINDMLICYVRSTNGTLIRAYMGDCSIRELREIGISMDEHGRINTY